MPWRPGSVPRVARAQCQQKEVVSDGAAAGGVSVVVVVVLTVVLPSMRVIGPNQVGLVMKRFSWRQLEGDSPECTAGRGSVPGGPADAGRAFQTVDHLQPEAQVRRVTMEQAKGTADMQAELARSAVGVEIEQNNAQANKARADGESTYISQTGTARGAEVRAIGLANAQAYERQVSAIGPEATAIVNAMKALAKSGTSIMPQALVLGGDGGGSLEALAASLVANLGLRGGGELPRSA